MLVIVGSGKTGQSCAEFLAQHGIDFATTDSRDEHGLNEALLEEANEIIVSPGISIHEPAIAKQIAAGKSVISDIELFSRYAKAPVIAITGTNGKTTVTTMVGEVAKACGIDARVGGNIGEPALSLLQKKEPDCYVLELSSFQLQSTFSLKPKVATVLNIKPDHLDWHSGFEEYKNAKLKIYNHCEFAIKPDESELDHNKSNESIVLAIAKVMGWCDKKALSVVKNFKGLPHRCQLIANIKKVAWYNDSKATNVAATLAAIKSLSSNHSGKIVLIAGGVGKNQDFSELKTPLNNSARAVILLGQAASELKKQFDQAVIVEGLLEAVKVAKEKAQPGDCVLLSPACASFDMFKNFEERGQAFVSYVEQVNGN